MSSEINLEPIIEYQMTSLEALAFKISITWQVLAKKIFPDRTIIHLKQKGDPRDCFLFKCCHKLVKDTQGLIPYNEYSLYVKAQLDIFKALESEKIQIDINPTCLFGPKSWVRWQIWKKKYDKISKRTDVDSTTINDVNLNLIKNDLLKTQKFLKSRFGDDYKEENIKNSIKDLERWVVLGRISPYYAILSPWMKKYYSHIAMDLKLYKINSEIEKEFKLIFNEN